MSEVCGACLLLVPGMCCNSQAYSAAILIRIRDIPTLGIQLLVELRRQETGVCQIVVEPSLFRND